MYNRSYSVDGIIASLGVSKYTVHRQQNRRQMQDHKTGSLWKFKRSEVGGRVRVGGAADVQRGSTT